MDVTQLSLESRKSLESRIRQNSFSGKDFGVKLPVAIKVLHPDVAFNFSRDLSVLKSLVAFLSHLFPSLEWLSLKESINEFASLMEIQVSFNY
jgi:predicted unusual protein kinase regulating ubiquinone biosynthesis (AarF/ABC1/UbiB family)